MSSFFLIDLNFLTCIVNIDFNPKFVDLAFIKVGLCGILK
jgi:hypothetical protein